MADALLKAIADTQYKDKPIICLGIEDSYGYRDPRLVKLITERYNGHLAQLRAIT